ncbi:MAG: glycosyltransferase [Patescibacteria group bacterium]|jgi:glycosyltransferase involved in cell wall biosynthesis|nr:glycosyltransferase [Patescibacteria group bacterium]
MIDNKIKETKEDIKTNKEIKEKNEGLKKIKIDYVIPTLDRGGAERFFVDLVKNLDRNKYEPRLVLYKRGGDWTKELIAYNIDFVILKKEKKISVSNFISLYKTIKKRKPDIVHTQLGGDIYGVLAAKLARVKNIVTTEVNTNQDESYIYNLVKRFTLSFVSWVVAVSNAVSSDIRKRYKLNPNKVIVIYNGIDLEKFSPSEEKNLLEHNKRKSFVFGSVGRLTEQKGYKYLIKAFSKIKSKRVKLHIAGEGHLKDELEEEIKKLGLEKRVKLVGHVNSAKFLKEIDAFVLPSLWEGMGIVLVEAALSGVPIIASKVGGIVEVVNKDSAYLVNPQSEEELEEAMEYLRENINSLEVASKIERASKEVKERFEIGEIVNKYQELYNNF